MKSNTSGQTLSLSVGYQVDVSVWAALDLLLAKKITDVMTLEAVSEEDLEADLRETHLGPVALKGKLRSYTLIVQAKMRETGPWSATKIADLLAHGGPRRPPACDRLKSGDARYLLVTSAGLNGIAHNLRVTTFGEWPSPEGSPHQLNKVCDTNVAGRIACLSSADLKTVEWSLRELLVDTFKVPQSQWHDCLNVLRQEASLRMKGAFLGEWTREALEAIVRAHGGYFANSPEAERFVRPKNWNEFLRRLREQHAVIITGKLGVGKTALADALWNELRSERPGLEHVVITVADGPAQIRARSSAFPTLFTIEDPWGTYELDSRFRDWRDALPNFLRDARSDRLFVITTRSDMLEASRAADSVERWCVKLEPEHYGATQRARIFRNRAKMLPREIQRIVLPHFRLAVERLVTPLEIEKYFDTIVAGPRVGETEDACRARALYTAKYEFVEVVLAEQIAKHSTEHWAAIVWGLLEARRTLSRGELPALGRALAVADNLFDYGLEKFINFLVSTRYLRQHGSDLTYYDRSIAIGLRRFINERPDVACRALSALVAVLVRSGTSGETDGRLSAVRIIRTIHGWDMSLELPTDVAEVLDDWLAERLATGGPDVQYDFRLAEVIGSPQSVAVQLAGWLLNTVPDSSGKDQEVWKLPRHSQSWYAQIAAHPLTPMICGKFVQYVLPEELDGYPADFYSQLARFSVDVAAEFRAAVLYSLDHGLQGNALAINHGATADLEGFQPVLETVLAVRRRLQEPDFSVDKSALSRFMRGEAIDSGLFERAASDFDYVVTSLLEVYAMRLRDASGWIALRDHLSSIELTSAWLDALKNHKLTPTDAELAELSARTFAPDEEQRFWALVMDQWRPFLLPRLLERIEAGHERAEVRQAAAACFTLHAAADGLGVVQRLLDLGNLRRPLEIMLDLDAAAIQFEALRSPAIALQDRCIAVFPKSLQPIALRLLEIPEDQPQPLSPEALQALQAIDPGSNGELRLHQARILANEEVDSGHHLDILLASAATSGTTADIQLATYAVNLSAELNQWSRVEAGLTHRFADVREAAMDALAEHCTSPLPASLLSIAKDEVSKLRFALAKHLRDRPHASHMDAIVTLVGDVRDRHIADIAADALAQFDVLDDTHLDPLLGVVEQTSDAELRQKLVDVLAAKGSDIARERLMILALQLGKTNVSIAACRALRAAATRLDDGIIVRITATHLLRRNAAVSVSIAMILGTRASEKQVLEIAKELAAHPKRRALLIALGVAAALHDPSVAREIALYLPRDHPARSVAAGIKAPRMAANAIDDLGDALLIEHLRSELPDLFEPEVTIGRR